MTKSALELKYALESEVVKTNTSFEIGFELQSYLATPRGNG